MGALPTPWQLATGVPPASRRGLKCRLYLRPAGAIEQLWADLRISIDAVVTYVRQAWNTALNAIAAQLDKIIAKTAQVLSKVWDPSGNAGKAAEALNAMGTLRGDATGANATLAADAEERRKAIEADAAAAEGIA